MAGAEPVLLPATAATGFLPDLDAIPTSLLERTALFFLCTPANPQGAWPRWTTCAAQVASPARTAFCSRSTNATASCGTRLRRPVRSRPRWRRRRLHAGRGVPLAEQAFEVPGLRSGFVAGDPAVIADLLRLRAYASPVQPLPLLAAAAALWRDETHVEANRARYRAKFDLAERRLSNRFGFYRPAGGFFLWLDVGDGEAACRGSGAKAAVRVLPGAYLSGADRVASPGRPYIRVALVDEPAVDAAGADDRVAGGSMTRNAAEALMAVRPHRCDPSSGCACAQGARQSCVWAVSC